MITYSNCPCGRPLHTQISAVNHLELERLAKELPQEVRQLRQNFRHIQPKRYQRVLARESKEMANQRHAAVGVLLDLHDVREWLLARPIQLKQ